MSRLLPLALVLALAATAWWLVARGETPAAEPGAPLPAVARLEPAAEPAPPALPTTADETSDPRPTDPLHPAAALGAASFTLTDATGRSLWCDGDSLTLWRMDTTPARAVTAQLTSTAAVQLVPDLLPGTYRADLRHQLLGRIVSTDLRVQAGETAREELPSGVADASRRVVIRLRNERDRDFPVDGFARVVVADGLGPERDALALGDGLFAADDIGPQGCDVTVSWFREPALHLRELKAGAVRTVELKGSATLLLTCIDNLGRRAAHTVVDLRLPSDASRIQRVLVATDDGGQLRLDRLPACDLVATIARNEKNMMGRSGCLAQDVPGLVLSSGGTLAREVHLEVGAQISGWAQYPTGEKALATVVLLAPRERLRALEDLDAAPAALVASLEKGGWHVWGVDQTQADAEQAAGSFRFPSVPVGPVRFVAATSPSWMGEPVELQAVAGSNVEDVVVPLPRSHGIHGQLVMPTGATAEELLAEARLPTGRRMDIKSVDAQGSFRLGPLPPGRCDVFLWSNSHASHDDPVPLGSLEVLADGDVERRFDLRNSAPGSLDVHVSIKDVLTSGITVAALAPEDDRLLASYMLDQQGFAPLNNLLRRRVKLRLSTNTWESVQPDPVDVPAWGRADVGIVLDIAASDVRVQAADGRSLVGTGIHVGRLDSTSWRAGSLYVLDANQSVHLVGPPGRFWFSLQAPGPVPDERLVTLRWPPEGGQMPTVIVGD